MVCAARMFLLISIAFTCGSLSVFGSLPMQQHVVVPCTSARVSRGLGLDTRGVWGLRGRDALLVQVICVSAGAAVRTMRSGPVAAAGRHIL